MRADIISTNYGTIITIEGVSARGRAFMRDVGDGSTVAQCDHRCGLDILFAALDRGLTPKDASTGLSAKGATK